MLAFLLSNLLDFQYWLNYPWMAVVGLFQLWMLLDAVRRREWIWALFILLGFGLAALFYYLMVYRAAPSATLGFELPGAHTGAGLRNSRAKSIIWTRPIITHSWEISIFNKANSTKPRLATVRRSNATRRISIRAPTSASVYCVQTKQRKPDRYSRALYPKTPSTITATPSWPWPKP
jgi:hypothetical protein